MGTKCRCIVEMEYQKNDRLLTNPELISRPKFGGFLAYLELMSYLEIVRFLRRTVPFF